MLFELEDMIMEAAREVQGLVDAEFDRVGGTPEPGSALDQCGLRDGLKIVTEYVQAGEAGLALEHLSYMVKETGIAVSEETLARIRALALEFGVRIEL